MPTYNEIKAELLEIVTILEKYPELVQPKVFEVLINHYLADPGVSSQPRSPQPKISMRRTNKSATQSKPLKRKISTSKESLSPVKDLNLLGGDGVQSFAEFNAEKNPKSNVEFNALAIYYLEKILGLNGIGRAHVFTCYRYVHRRPPLKFTQSLWDTSGSRYGYIDASDINDLKVPHRGIVFVEHELPRKDTKT